MNVQSHGDHRISLTIEVTKADILAVPLYLGSDLLLLSWTWTVGLNSQCLKVVQCSKC